jgi:hypothetical protein
VYYNTAGVSNNLYRSTATFTCTVPGVPGAGNITNDPQFVDAANSNFHLQATSPCINAGTNQSWMTGAADLDGNPRIFGIAGCGRVDMGAYEYQGSVSRIPTNWLALYGLAIDGSEDDAYGDSDPFSNWQEWRSGTNPTNPLSLLRVEEVAGSSAPTGMLIRWQSATGILYAVDRGTNLALPLPFVNLASNIVGQTNSTTYIDTNAAAPGPYFYRIGVQ